MTRATLSRDATASLQSRCAPFISLIIPLLVSATLLAIRDVRAYGAVHDYVESHRTTITVIVQLLSSILGILQIGTLTMLIQYGARVRLAHSSMQLDTIGLLTALSVPRIPWNLPAASLVVTISMAVIAQGPGALWAGAITPVTIQETLRIGSMTVPLFSASSAHIWDSEFSVAQNNDVWNYITKCVSERGSAASISNCPVPNNQALLLEAAREATSPSNAAPRNHSKPDNPAWTYTGRSYGVGAAQGLQAVQGVPPAYKLLGYVYNETGYLSSVSCTRNTSTNLTYEHQSTVNLVDIWYITGSLPNSVSPEYYPVMAWYRDSFDEAPVLAWAGVSPAYGGSHMIGIVASAMYGNFSQLQCSVVFTPTLFAVDVNTTAQSIVVTPLRDNVSDHEPTGHLQSNAIWSLNLLSRMSTSLYVSVLGEALTYNLGTLLARSPSLDPTQLAMRAAEDSFVAMLDTTLGIYGGAQLALANASTPVSIAGAFEAIRIGEPLYQWAVAAVNVILLVLVAVEGIRTRWWYRLPQFDPLDFKTTVAAASFGGKALGRELQRRLHGRVWAGKAKDPVLGHMAVRLQETRGQLAIVLGSNEGEADEELEMLEDSKYESR